MNSSKLTILAVLKKQCNMNLQRLTDADVLKWTSQTSDQDTSHQDELKFKCEHCGKSFAFDSQLKSHKVIHKKLATLKCNKSLPYGTICNKWFKRDGELKKHMKVYDSYLWQCKDCQYSTFYERNLKQHRRKHTGEKTFKCFKCGKNFAYWTQKSRHKCD